MKVVLDTNVLVSGILFTGPPHQILLAWSEGRFELVLTSDIHDEYRRVAAELQQQFPRVDLAAALDLIVVNAQVFTPIVLERQILRRPGRRQVPGVRPRERRGHHREWRQASAQRVRLPRHRGPPPACLRRTLPDAFTQAARTAAGVCGGPAA